MQVRPGKKGFHEKNFKIYNDKKGKLDNIFVLVFKQALLKTQPFILKMP